MYINDMPVIISVARVCVRARVLLKADVIWDLSSIYVCMEMCVCVYIYKLFFFYLCLILSGTVVGKRRVGRWRHFRNNIKEWVGRSISTFVHTAEVRERWWTLDCCFHHDTPNDIWPGLQTRWWFVLIWAHKWSAGLVCVILKVY